ncbi:MAG: peptidoglycan D,D-transpeptidase FtsI family protein [Acidimicrobiia bacterium]
MNVGIRRVGIGVVVLLVVLVGQLTYLQVLDAKHLANNGNNPRKIFEEFNSPRGKIISADGQVLARSVDIKDEFGKQREYPLGELVSQIVGYQSVTVGSTGLEKTYDDVLLGKGRSTVGLQQVVDFLKGKKRVGNLVTSLRVDAQLKAKEALGSQRGSVVVIKPDTGEIVAMYSNPSFDPTPLASHNATTVQQYFDQLNAPDSGNPALPRAYREIYPPGSTFKVVTTTASLDNIPNVTTQTFPTLTQLPVPQSTNTIANFGHSSCGGTLENSFIHSCNTTFAALGLQLGNLFPPAMGKFGIFSAPPLDIAPGAATSTGPTEGTFDNNKPRFALAGIGQGDVAATPLQMALVASGIANGGEIMRPHVGVAVTDDAGKEISKIGDRPWRRATSAATANTVRDYMVQVVNSPGGTGTSARIAGITVAGKTGTAQTTTGEFPHAWFVAFAPAEAPKYAVAVIVEHGGSAQSEATGGKVAAPIARTMLQFLLST